MPNRSRQKGDREERAIVNNHKALGIKAERTLESGKRSDGSSTWDINLETPIGSLKGECKVKKSGFKMIYDWLKNDFLTIRTDGNERLYIVPERIWEKIMVALKEKK
jgi:hypothetical protein